MMSIGEKFALICLQSIDDKKEKKQLINLLIETKKEIIEVSESQIENFAGNILEVKGANEKNYLIMSTRAFNCLDYNQKNKLEKNAEILHSNLDTIEKIGGGSARCMLTEIFLPKKK